MHLTKFIIFLINILIATNTYCQDTIITNVIVFDKSELSDTSNKKHNTQFKHAVKINPLLFLRGEVPIYYEHVINNHFSLEASIGLAFKDYLGNAFEGMTSGFNDLSLEEYSEKSKANVSFSFGIRYFPSAYALEGIYFALYYAKRNFDRDISLTNNSQYIDPNTFNFTSSSEILNFTEERHHNEIRLIYGENEFYYWDNSFLDFYIGAGIDFYSTKKVEIETATDFMGQNKTYDLESSQSIVPRFYLGVKYGFGF